MGLIKTAMIIQQEKKVKKINEESDREHLEITTEQRFGIILSNKRKEWLSKSTFEHRLRCALLDLKLDGIKLIPNAKRWSEQSTKRLQKALAGTRWITANVEFENGTLIRDKVLITFGISKGRRPKAKKYDQRLKEFRALLARIMYRYSIRCEISIENNCAWISS